MNPEKMVLFYCHPELAKERRAEILKLYAFGTAIKDIAAQMELSYSRCNQLLNKAAEETGLSFMEAIGSINPNNPKFLRWKEWQAERETY